MIDYLLKKMCEPPQAARKFEVELNINNLYKARGKLSRKKYRGGYDTQV
jgi:hypothetical protein